jgi:aminoglycoside 3-N-acetyltransferase
MDMLTVESLATAFEDLGVRQDHTVMVHASLSKVQDWICGGIDAVIQAFDRVLGERGTLVMPAHSAGNSEPSEWRNPPVPEDWWPLIRAHMPPYHPDTTQTRRMGVLAETFRRYPGTRRSGHPQVSVAARGKHAAWLTAEHLLTDGFGSTSPYAKLAELDAYVLLLGVGHSNNSTLHLAETRAAWPSKSRKVQGAAVSVNGERRWVTFEDWAEDADDFDRIGAAYEAGIAYTPGRVGQAEARYLRLRPLVEFAVGWIEKNRS